MHARISMIFVLVIGCDAAPSTPDGAPVTVIDAAPPGIDAEEISPDAAAAADAHVHPPDAMSIDATVIDATVIDASPAPDAGPPTVFVVACPTPPRVTVIAGQGSYAFVPEDGVPDDAYTIAVGDIVRFETSPVHDVASGTSGAETDEFFVDVDTVACLQFTAAGEFPFYCTLHGFDAVLIVE